MAFRHRSASEKKINGLKLNNERLEYLGDAILSAIVADLLFKRFPYKNEGFLTQMRSKIVSRSSLNHLSNKLGLNKLINLSTDLSLGGRSAPGDTFEAVVGAIYLDKGYGFTRNILIKRIINIHFDLDKLVNTEVNFKSRVLEWAQKEKHELIFRVIDEIGEKQSKQYLVAVIVDGKNIAQAQDYNIKGAEKLASERAWQKLND
ncbi:MAG TPA: ribonuclease III [Bacteroidetes bacterium]|nr:ribonuclease III [Bacteroidota bacterium]